MKRLMAGWVLMLAAIAVGIVVRRSNQDLPEKRLLLKFWPLWILVAVVSVLGGLIAGLWPPEDNKRAR